MKRSMCGGFLLASLVGLGACSGDPTGDLVGADPTVQSDPTSLFVNHGEEEALIVSVADAQGNEQDITEFSAQAGSGVITVAEDTTFLQTNAGGRLGTARRVSVNGVTPGATTVNITANGQTLAVPVKVAPVGLTVTLSNALPAANEQLVITLPAGYKFGEGAGASVGEDAGITTAVAADSTSINAVLPPGATGTLTVNHVAADFAPGVLFDLPTTETVTVGAATAIPGTGDPATAPALSIPPPGGTTALYDAPDFAGQGFFSFYRFDVAEPGDYTVTLDWSTGSDLDLYFCFDAACADGDFSAATGAHPESATYTVETAGTFYVVVNDYAGDAVGTTISLTVDR